MSVVYFFNGRGPVVHESCGIFEYCHCFDLFVLCDRDWGFVIQKSGHDGGLFGGRSTHFFVFGGGQFFLGGELGLITVMCNAKKRFLLA